RASASTAPGRWTGHMTIRTVVAPAVALDSVTRTYRSRAGSVHALRGVTHAFAAGTFTAIMGPSGSGKSTLLQLAAGLDKPTGGRVYISGTDLGGLRETALTKFRRTAMAFIFQSYNLLDALSAFDNVALPTRLAGLPVDRAAVTDALGRVGLRDLSKRRPPELSRRQAQRATFRPALYGKPQVLFADEPPGALDRNPARDVLDLIRGVEEG